MTQECTKTDKKINTEKSELWDVSEAKKKTDVTLQADQLEKAKITLNDALSSCVMQCDSSAKLSIHKER